jgi:hypothetical protein
VRSRYRPTDLPDPGGLAVVTIDDPFPSLEIGARLEPARHSDGSTAESAPGWTPPPRPPIAVIASLKEDPLDRMHAGHQIDRAQFLGAREYQELYDTTQRGHVRSVDLTKNEGRLRPIDGSADGAAPVGQPAAAEGRRRGVTATR